MKEIKGDQFKIKVYLYKMKYNVCVLYFNVFKFIYILKF